MRAAAGRTGDAGWLAMAGCSAGIGPGPGFDMVFRLVVVLSDHGTRQLFGADYTATAIGAAS